MKLELELQSITKEHETLKVTTANEENKSKVAVSKSKKIERAYEMLTKDLKEKVELIGILETTGSSLKKELLDVRGELEKLTRDFNLSQMEKKSLQAQVDQTQENSKTIEQYKKEIVRMKEEETMLKETFERF